MLCSFAFVEFGEIRGGMWYMKVISWGGGGEIIL